MDKDKLADIYAYMRRFAPDLGERILERYPALHQFADPISPRVSTLLRTPFPAQSVAMMGIVKRWQIAPTALVVAECGAGKTLISLGAMHVSSEGQPYTAIAMVPPHLVVKWAREAFLTIPGIRVFLIDDMRNGGDTKSPHGVNEVQLQGGTIIRKGLQTTLSDLRLRKLHANSRKRWLSLCRRPALFIVGRERAKLGYFWRHAFRIPRSGPNLGCAVNSDTGQPIVIDERRLTQDDFDKIKLSETIDSLDGKPCRTFHSALWQADPTKLHRMAPIEFIGRYLDDEWFDYAICDEVHQLAGDTAQGNALGTLACCAGRSVGLTGTLLGGYADDVYNTLFRLEPRKMKDAGYEFGTTGRSAFTQDYGVLETITRIESGDNACSKAKAAKTVRRKPGASPLLFGQHLMQLCAFVFLEDISSELPPYEESLLSVPMDGALLSAYEALEEEIRQALKKHRGNRSVLSTMLNTLLLYPDHPYGLGTLYGSEYDPELGHKVKFVIAETTDLPEDKVYPKERKLIDEIKSELAQERRVQVFAVYTQKHDVPARLERILSREGVRTAVLRANVDTSKREAWYARKVKEGVEVVITHPRIVETGLDLWDFPTIIFHESGYSLHTLRQASRRSWRIGQRLPVRVKFMCYDQTLQAACLRLMGKKLLVALTMEGKFAGEGLQSMDEDDDMLSAMARELVEKNGIGESADNVWRALTREHQKLFPVCENPSHLSSEVTEAPGTLNLASEPDRLIEDAIGATKVLVFGQRPETLRPRRRQRAAVPEQPFLFGMTP
jgi:superfamily II DNA or RNA helicase